MEIFLSRYCQKIKSIQNAKIKIKSIINSTFIKRGKFFEIIQIKHFF